jgi:hypothetical protein
MADSGRMTSYAEVMPVNPTAPFSGRRRRACALASDPRISSRLENRLPDSSRMTAHPKPFSDTASQVNSEKVSNRPVFRNAKSPLFY